MNKIEWFIAGVVVGPIFWIVVLGLVTVAIELWDERGYYDDAVRHIDGKCSIKGE